MVDFISPRFGTDKKCERMDGRCQNYILPTSLGKNQSHYFKEMNCNLYNSDFVLFILTSYIPVNSFSVMLGQFIRSRISTKQRI